MRTVRAEGPAEVATVLRDLAGQVEASMPSICAVVEMPEDTERETVVLNVQLSHPRRHRWSLTRLESALSRPGD